MGIRSKITERRNRRIAAATLAGILLTPAFVFAGSATYTLNTDFDGGVLSGVNHDAPGADQLQLNVRGTTFPVLWIANAGEDTLTKFDSNTNKEIARYRTWFGPSGQPGYAGHNNNAWAGAAPSRTAVDITGNAYVLNRHFDNKKALLIKVLAAGGIDRNGNGIIDTSADTNNNGIIELAEMKPLADNTPANGRLDTNEITDERIAWAVEVGNNNGLGRSLCIGTDGNIWVGLFNQRAYYKVNANDGSIMQGPISVPWPPYGCAVDSNGILWSASLGSVLGKLNTTTLAVNTYGHSGSNYGIAIGNGKVYLANSGSGSSFIQFNPTTNLFSYPGLSFASTGISVDGDGNILSGRYSGGGIVKYNKDTNAVIFNAPTQQNVETRGVIIDADNSIWQINLNGNNMSKYSSTGGPLGVFPVGNRPYTYSDASGFAARNITSPTGTWTVVKDGAAANVVWGTVSWNGVSPTGSSIQVAVRTANTLADLDLQTYTPVVNNTPFSKVGRYLQIESRLNANASGQSPVLYDLTVKNGTCDVNGDGSINKTDISLITAARNLPAGAFDSRDADGDGFVTVNDARACTLRCTKPYCAL